MTDQHLELRVLSGENLAGLLAVAVAESDPLEVMPPVPGADGWDEARRRAFCDVHRTRSISAAEPVEVTYVGLESGHVMGAARLQRAGGDVEIGLWLGGSHRGRGVGRRVVAALVGLAERSALTGWSPSTGTNNGAAQRLLARAGGHSRDGR